MSTSSAASEASVGSMLEEGDALFQQEEMRLESPGSDTKDGTLYVTKSQVRFDSDDGSYKFGLHAVTDHGMELEGAEDCEEPHMYFTIDITQSGAVNSEWKSNLEEEGDQATIRIMASDAETVEAAYNAIVEAMGGGGKDKSSASSDDNEEGGEEEEGEEEEEEGGEDEDE